jgi:hypothetical protein
MMGTRFDMFDTFFFKLFFKPRGAPPVGVLAPVIGEHLLGNTIFADRPPVGFDHVRRRLAAV